MSFRKQYLRHYLLFAFQLEKKAKAKEIICSALGENAVSCSTCKKWFQQFQEGNFNLQDSELWSTKKMEDEELKQILFTKYE